MGGESVRVCPTVDKLPQSWNVFRLGDFCSKIGTGATPRGGSEAYLDNRKNYALIRSQNVLDRSFDTAGLAFISDEQAKDLRNASVQSGDILLNITGDGVTFSRTCIAPSHILPACVNQHVAIIRPNPSICDAGYLLSVLTHPLAKGYIESYNSGGSRRAITKGHIESFGIVVPPLGTQKSIAEILGSLDAKIESNRRINSTLEEMARTLFKSWFVDFDPVRRNMERGGKPKASPKSKASLSGQGELFDFGQSTELDALFPSSFEESTLGPIPKGWLVSTISDVSSINANSLSRNDRMDTVEYVEISEVQRGDIATIATYPRGGEPSRAKRRIQHGDTVISSVRPDRGSYFLALNPPQHRLVSTGFAVLSPCGVPWSVLHAAIIQPSVFEYLGKMADGGAYPAVRPEVIGGISVVLPKQAIICDKFHQICASIFEKMEANRIESRTLASLRDTLLPKLLSGELSLTEAAKLEVGG